MRFKLAGAQIECSVRDIQRPRIAVELSVGDRDREFTTRERDHGLDPSALFGFECPFVGHFASIVAVRFFERGTTKRSNRFLCGSNNAARIRRPAHAVPG